MMLRAETVSISFPTLSSFNEEAISKKVTTWSSGSVGLKTTIESTEQSSTSSILILSGLRKEDYFDQEGRERHCTSIMMLTL